MPYFCSNRKFHFVFFIFSFAKAFFSISTKNLVPVSHGFSSALGALAHPAISIYQCNHLPVSKFFSNILNIMARIISFHIAHQFIINTLFYTYIIPYFLFFINIFKVQNMGLFIHFGMSGHHLPRPRRSLYTPPVETPAPAHPDRLHSTGGSTGRTRCRADHDTRPDAGHAAPDTRQATPGRLGRRRVLEGVRSVSDRARPNGQT